MVRKLRAQRSTNTHKRPIGDIETSSMETPVHVDSGDDKSEMGFGSTAKRLKMDIEIRDEFKERYASKDIANRQILLGKPIKGPFLKASGALDLFSNIGMNSFLDLPEVCYPNLVKSFYGNLHVNDKGHYVSFISGIKITITPVILDVILGISPAVESVSVYKKRGQNNLEGFSAIEQLRIVCGDVNLTEFVVPTTSQVMPMAHLLFRICLANICPRLGTKSNLSCQDVTVIAMIMSGKKFDLSDLVLQNMMEVFTAGNSMGLPYGLLLTKVFEYMGVDTAGEESVVVKDFLDAKGFGHSGLSLDGAGKLVWEEAPPQTPAVKNEVGASVKVKPPSEEELRIFMGEVRASLARIHKDSEEFREQLKKIVSTLKLQGMTSTEIQVVSTAAEKLLQQSEDDKNEDEEDTPEKSKDVGTSEAVEADNAV